MLQTFVLFVSMIICKLLFVNRKNRRNAVSVHIFVPKRLKLHICRTKNLKFNNKKPPHSQANAERTVLIFNERTN
nr:MAG TPA: hypothetical protein [Bacteriophage sp.]